MKKNLHPPRAVYSIMLILSIVGIYFSIVLGAVHNTPDQANWVAASLCGGKGSYFDCQKINSSDFSSLLGIPLAFWGVAFFTLFLLITVFLFFYKGESAPFWHTILFWFLLIGSLFDILLLIYSVGFVKGVCPLCIITYLANWIGLGILYWKRDELIPNGFSPLQTMKSLLNNGFEGLSLGKVTLILIIFGVLSVVAAFGSQKFLAMSKPQSPNQDQEKIIAQILAQYQQGKRYTINFPNTPAYGQANAPVTIVEFSDFMCPICERVAPLLKKIIDNNPGKLRLVFMNYPLDSDCNKGMTRQMHKGACLLARAVTCAAPQQKFWQMHDKIFQTITHFANRNMVTNMAEQLGMDMKKFNACVDSPTTAKAITDQIEEGDKLEISGTPTLFINGRRYQAAPHPILIERIMQLELNEK